MSSASRKPSQRKLRVASAYSGRADDDAEHRDDADRQELGSVAEEHQPVERVGDRRDEAERLHALRVGGDERLLQGVRVLGDVAEHARDPPHAATTAPMPSRRAGCRPSGPRAARTPSRAARRRAPRPSSRGQRAFDDAGRRARASDGRSWPVGSVTRRLVDGVDAGHRGDALQRRERGDAEHDEHHQRLQVAAADAHQRLAAAARASTMPKPNSAPPTSADSQIKLRRRRRCSCDGVDPAERDHRVEADASRRPSPAPTCACGPVAHVDHVGDGAHGAEVGALRDRAEHAPTGRTRPRAPAWRRRPYDRSSCMRAILTRRAASGACRDARRYFERRERARARPAPPRTSDRS